MKATFFNAFYQYGERHEFYNYLKINVLKMNLASAVF